MLPTASPLRVPALVRALLAVAAVLYVVGHYTPNGIGDVIAADQGDIPADSFPGSADGFERGIDADGQESYKYEYEDKVYVVPADQYYRWREDYYHDGYNGGLTHAMLIALLLRPTYHPHMYSPTYFHRSYHWGAATTPYYSSPAYTSHFGTPHVQNGRVVHTSAATGRPVGAGTPVAHARPVATGRPVGAATPVAKGTPVATAKPAPAKPAPRPVSRWASARSHHSRGHFCFAEWALVTRPDGTAVPISSLKAGEDVAAWPNAASTVKGDKPAALRIKHVHRHETAEAGSAAPLHGLRLSGSKRIAPFVTSNHPLLGKGGVWTAVDAAHAADELAAYAANHTHAGKAEGTPPPPPAVRPLRAGDEVLVGKKAMAMRVEEVVEPTVEEAAAQAKAGVVYSLELDVPGYAVYMVNGVLVMD